MKIVSANYLDRSSPYRWLVRDKSEDVGQGRACKMIEATNVSFVTSSKFEEGFGCRKVAHVYGAIKSYAHEGDENQQLPEEENNDLVRLNFDPSNGAFCTARGREVDSAKKLFLFPNGSMFAVL